MNEIYVQLRNKRAVRQELLLASKSSVEVLKKMNEVIMLRQEKLETIKQLMAALKELAGLQEMLNKQLPGVKYDIPKVPQNKVEHEKVTKKSTDLERLNDSIEKLEQELMKLQE